MDLLLPSTLFLYLIISLILSQAEATTFNFVNKCGETIWPGILSNAGSPQLGTTGFELPSGSSRAVPAPPGWSGRFWGRTLCAATPSAGLSCATGDCGSGKLECSGAGASPPATLAEFTLGSSQGRDFYDVSLVDGYNLPVTVAPSGAGCGSAGCAVDLNQRCPSELRVGDGAGEACRSACEAFGKAEYCCSGAFANPDTCRPTVYSQVFKAACPKSYSYAFDDPTSTFTCAGGADYTVTFCPVSMPSTHKSSQDSSSTPSTPSNTTPRSTTTTTGGVMLEDDSWLANLAIGNANSIILLTPHLFKVIATTIAFYSLLLLF